MPAALARQPVPNQAPAPRVGHLEFDLAMRHSGLRRVGVRFADRGPVHAPVLVVAGGISAGRAVGDVAGESGWWPAQVGAGRVLDPARRRVVSLDWLGADGRLDCVIDPRDQADAIAAVLDHLAVPRVAAFVGASYGAMVGLQFAARHGERLQRLVAISGTHRAHPYASAWRALQRRALALGAVQCDDGAGVALARQLAMLAYRTPREFAERFPPAAVAHGRVRVGAEDYLDHCGRTFAQRHASVAYLRLSESLDLQAVDPAAITVPTTLVAVPEDMLIPVDDAYELAHGLRGETRLRVIRSRYGHDAFLKEHEAIAGVLAEALEGVA